MASYLLNRAVLMVEKRLRQEAKTGAGRFDKIFNFTKVQFRYDKPQQIGKNLEASVFIVPRINNGNAPSKYLAPHIYGGSAYRTSFQRLLETTDYIGRNSKPILKKEIMTPVLKNSLVRKSKFGGMSRGQWSTIADQMRGKSKPANNRYFYIGDEIQRAAAKMVILYQKKVYICVKIKKYH